MKIIYVCTGNSFRSPVAEALTRKYKPHLEVESAGTSPASRIAGVARELLENINAQEYLKPDTEGVTKTVVEGADLAVVMEEEHENHLLENFGVSREKIENWNIVDPINPDIEPERVFEEIEERVKEL